MCTMEIFRLYISDGNIVDEICMMKISRRILMTEIFSEFVRWKYFDERLRRKQCWPNIVDENIADQILITIWLNASSSHLAQIRKRSRAVRGRPSLCFLSKSGSTCSPLSASAVLCVSSSFLSWDESIPPNSPFESWAKLGIVFWAYLGFMLFWRLGRIDSP